MWLYGPSTLSHPTLPLVLPPSLGWFGGGGAFHDRMYIKIRLDRMYDQIRFHDMYT
jgi:hypothetical protein